MNSAPLTIVSKVALCMSKSMRSLVQNWRRSDGKDENAFQKNHQSSWIANRYLSIMKRPYHANRFNSTDCHPESRSRAEAEARLHPSFD